MPIQKVSKGPLKILYHKTPLGLSLPLVSAREIISPEWGGACWLSSLVLSATGRAEVSAEHRSMKHHCYLLCVLSPYD